MLYMYITLTKQFSMFILVFKPHEQVTSGPIARWIKYIYVLDEISDPCYLVLSGISGCGAHAT